jgi:hypothetical protein
MNIEVERWAEDHCTFRGFGPISGPLNGIQFCEESSQPVGGFNARNTLDLKIMDRFSDRHIRRGLQTGRLRLRGITKIENGPRVKLSMRAS